MLPFWILAALVVKHFLCDFPLQTKYMREGKTPYLADGGIHHAFFHGIVTAMVFVAFGMHQFAGTLAVLDTLVHYHVDYFKARLTSHFKLTTENHAFWQLLGGDQMIHHLTYVGLVALAFNA